MRTLLALLRRRGGIGGTSRIVRPLHHQSLRQRRIAERSIMARTMSKQNQSSGSLAPWLGVALIVILFDQLSKMAVARVFTYGEPHALTPFFNLFLIYNRGAAFSFLASSCGWQRWAFTALPAAGGGEK